MMTKEAIERAVERARHAVTLGWPPACLDLKDFYLICTAAARAAELERECAEAKTSERLAREEFKRSRAEHHADLDLWRTERDAAVARAEELTTDLHELREAAEWRAEQVRNREREAASYGEQIHALNRIAGELRAERDSLGQCAEEWKAEAKHYAVRLAAAEGALQPFARMGEAMGPIDYDGNSQITLAGTVVTFADFQTARTALAPSAGERQGVQEEAQAVMERQDSTFRRLAQEDVRSRVCCQCGLADRSQAPC